MPTAPTEADPLTAVQMGINGLKVRPQRYEFKIIPSYQIFFVGDIYSFNMCVCIIIYHIPYVNIFLFLYFLLKITAHTTTMQYKQ